MQIMFWLIVAIFFYLLLDAIKDLYWYLTVGRKHENS